MKKLFFFIIIFGFLISCKNQTTVDKNSSNNLQKILPTRVLSSKKNTDYQSRQISKKNIKKIKLEKNRNIEPIIPNTESIQILKPKNSSLKSTISKTEKPISNIIDASVNSKIQSVVSENKNVMLDLPKSGDNHKTIYGILGVLLIAIAALFLFKKK